MPSNDETASSILAAKVGAIRHGAKLYRSVGELLDEEQLKRSARKVGRQLDAQLGDFYDQRVKTLMERIGRDDLKEPTRDPSLRFMRGDAEQFMVKSAAHDSVALTRTHARTVARSGANAAHNAAVLAIARANRDAVVGVMALATLDNRTSELCRDRHGGAWDLSTGEPLPYSTVDESFPGRPPWHFNCRTTLTPVFADEDVPTIQEESTDDWLLSEDGRDALGSDRVDAFVEGRMTRTQLILGGTDEEEPLDLGKKEYVPVPDMRDYDESLKMWRSKQMDSFRWGKTVVRAPLAESDKLEPVKNDHELRVLAHDLSSEQLDRAKKALDDLPADLRATVKAAGSSVVFSSDVMGLTEEEVGQKGLEADYAKKVNGYYNRQTGAVVIHLGADSIGTREALNNTLVHELGHSVDFHATTSDQGLMTDSDVFRNAQHADEIENRDRTFRARELLPPKEAHWIAYSGMNLREKWAELFSVAIGGGHQYPRVARVYEEIYPRTLSIVREMWRRYQDERRYK